MPPSRLATLLVVSALAGPAAAEQLPIQSFTTADGLAHDRVECIVQDSVGFVWFCTPEGLSRFDGYAFRNFGRESGLPSPSVHGLVEAGDGLYWVATGGGLCLFEASKSRCDPRPLGRPGEAPLINALARDPAGRVWVGNDDGLYRNAGSTSSAFEPVALDARGSTGTVEQLAAGPDGSVWAGAGRSLWRILPDGRTSPYRLPRAVSTIAVDARGHAWVGYRGGTVVVLPPPLAGLPAGPLPLTDVSDAPDCGVIDQLRPGEACSVVRSDLPRHSGRAIEFSADGTAWVGTQNQGLLRIDSAGRVVYTTEQGLTSEAVFALLEDRRGDLWIGTEGRGVMRWLRRGLISYGRRDGLANPRIYSVFGGRSGGVYAVSGSSLLYHLAGRTFETVEPLDRTALAFRFGSRVALEDSQGAWWLAGRGGLRRFEKVRSFADLGRPLKGDAFGDPDRPRSSIGALFEDSHGDVWAGSIDNDETPPHPRLLRWERRTGALQWYALPAATSEWTSIAAIVEDRAGTLWLGAAESGQLENVGAPKTGLLRWRDGRVEAVTPDGWKAPNEVIALHVDRAGRLWFAAGREGLGRIDEPAAARPRAVLYSTAQGLSSEVVRSVTEDRWGRIYAGTNVGIDRIDVASGRVQHFGVADGLSAGQVETSFADGTGRLWFGTPDGISVLTPDVDPPPSLEPPRILSVRVAGSPRPLPGLGTLALAGLELSAHEAPIEIAFATLGGAPGVRPQYRMRLEGAQADWGPATETHEVTYARLPAGSYRFAVQAWSPGAQSPPATYVAFRVLPPLWKRWWFVAGAIALAALFAYAAFRYRIRMLLELERVRTRIATDLHDDIGSSLSRIAILSEVARRQGPDGANGSLVSIADISRELVDSMSDIVWSVNPQRDTLRDLTQRMRALATEVFSALDIDLRFRGPAGDASFAIGADLRRQVFLVFKEAVNNAATHARCRRVEVDFSFEGRGLVLRVADDGCGLPPDRNGDGHGLASMAARARAIGGALDVRSEPGGGTSVTLRVPDLGGAGVLQRLGLAP